jgi:hypothetical protein
MTRELDKQIADLINNDDYDQIDLAKVIELIVQGGDVNINPNIAYLNSTLFKQIEGLEGFSI